MRLKIRAITLCDDLAQVVSEYDLGTYNAELSNVDEVQVDDSADMGGPGAKYVMQVLSSLSLLLVLPIAPHLLERPSPMAVPRSASCLLWVRRASQQRLQQFQKIIGA